MTDADCDARGRLAVCPGVHLNTMVLASREPVVLDTGVAADRDRWLDSVGSVVEPDDVRWIVLTHDDHAHTGNREAAVEHVPTQPSWRRGVVESWWMNERLTGSIELDPRRMRWRSVPSSEDVPQPGQADLDAIAAPTLVAA